MSSARKSKTRRRHQDEIDYLASDVVIVKPTEKPEGFPPEARPRSSLDFPYKKAEDQKTSLSAHSVNKAIKKIKGVVVNYFFKNNPYDAANRYPYISELEALCTAFYHFLAPENVPSAKAYYDFINPEVGYGFVGVASKTIPNFVPNYDAPLLADDIKITPIMESINEEIDNKKDALVHTLNAIIGVLDRKPPSTTGYFYSGLQYTKNLYNFFRNNTAVNLKDYLKSVVHHSYTINHETVDTLLSKLLERQKLIASQLKDPQYERENELLQQAIEVLEEIIAGSFQYVYILEELDRIFKQKNIKLSMLDEKSILTEKIYDQDVYISVKDMKNYRIVKRQAVGLVNRYLMQDTDGHNRNMSKDGWIIDFDMAKLRILFQFRKQSKNDKLLRRPNDTTFIVTANDIANFPDIQDANFYYWVTKQTVVPESLNSGLSWFHLVPENFFRKSDSDVYKNLARNPVFVFHKYKSFLKYILTDETIFRNLGKLHLRENLKYQDEKDGVEKNLLDEIIRDESERIKEVREVLVHMPMFQKYLATHGRYVFKLIKEEFETFKEKKASKLEKKPYFKDLVDSIDIEKIEARYNDIVKEARKHTKGKPLAITANRHPH